MSNVVKLVSGGAIQVRTGVIQGIGPVGPRGVSGVQGVQGDQGPVGETGPMGQILTVQGRSNVGSANALAANTDTVIGFGDISYDEPGFFFSAANIVLHDPGDYLISVYLRFDDVAAGLREVSFTSVTNGEFAHTSRQSTAGRPFYVDLAYPYRVDSPGEETINVIARSAQALNVSAGAITVTRVGSGEKGDKGDLGPVGPPGATGAQGIQGEPGTPGGAYASYDDLVGH